VVEKVRLKDGTSVLVRPVRPDDRELDFFTRLDHDLHEAIGAIDLASGERVGVARMHRHDDDPSIAEAAVTIVDDWQGRGLGGLDEPIPAS
jgi:hypothetical protein